MSRPKETGHKRLRHKGTERKLSISKDSDSGSHRGSKLDLTRTKRHHEDGAENGDINRRTNLDSFLDDLYRQVLRVKTGKDEVKFIKRGIEHLVECIAKLVLVYGQGDVENIMADYKYAYPGATFIDNPESVLKVGSIYDKTRNTYPDEFDFVLVLFTFYCESYMHSGYTKFGYTYKEKFKVFHHLIRNMLSVKSISESLVYRNPQENDQEIRFDKYTRLSGCSSRLQFSYENRHSIIAIYVDIVISTKRIDPQLEFKNLSSLESFDKEIAKTGSVLYVNEKLVFTETEVTFVKRVMSAKHRKAYRILKYLINGHKDGEVLDNLLLESGFQRERITSHMIKTEMIHHECSCQRTGNGMASCVLDILHSLKYYDSNNILPSLSHDIHVAHFFKSVDKQRALENMFFILNAMKVTKRPYFFQRDSVTPIARSLIVYPNEPLTPRTKMKPSDWIACVGSYCVNIAEILLAVSLFSVFLFLLIQHF